MICVPQRKPISTSSKVVSLSGCHGTLGSQRASIYRHRYKKYILTDKQGLPLVPMSHLHVSKPAVPLVEGSSAPVQGHSYLSA